MSEYYGRWAGLYDRSRRLLPGRRRVRARIVDTLDLHPGDQAIDVGCGPGSSLQALAAAVGPTGTVIGLDRARRMLDRARSTIGDHPAVSLVCGDARSLPTAGPVDGLLSTFVVGMFATPEAIVDRWWETLGTEGAMTLASFAPSPSLWALPARFVYRLLAGLATPPLWSVTVDADRVRTHRNRIARAHARLTTHASHSTDTRIGGLIRLTTGYR